MVLYACSPPLHPGDDRAVLGKMPETYSDHDSSNPGTNALLQRAILCLYPLRCVYQSVGVWLWLVACGANSCGWICATNNMSVRLAHGGAHDRRDPASVLWASCLLTCLSLSPSLPLFLFSPPTPSSRSAGCPFLYPFALFFSFCPLLPSIVV